MLDLPRFFKATNPAETLSIANPEERKYYIDFSSVRGGQIFENFKRTIALLSPDEYTCQLLTGNIGCGKSTELLRLKIELEQIGFHVIYIESSKDVDMSNVEISDILLSLVYGICESLYNLHEIESNEARELLDLLRGAKQLLQIKDKTSTTISEIDINQNTGNSEKNSSIEAPFTERDRIIPFFQKSFSKVTLIIRILLATSKGNPDFQSQLRVYLEPKISELLDAINKELLEPATDHLKQLGKKGIVILVDNLDRITNSLKPSGRPQPEYIFIDRGEHLTHLKCHIIYNIPQALIFSDEYGLLVNRIGRGLPPKIISMVPVQLRNGQVCEEGMRLLRQMVLTRAFPDLDEKERLNKITEVFDSPETLDRLCCVSGGHIRNLLQLLYSCLQIEDPPLSRDTLEKVIIQRRYQLTVAIEDEEWNLLQRVATTKTVGREIKYQSLNNNFWIFEYRYGTDSWFDINPVLLEGLELRKKHELLEKSLAQTQHFLTQAGATFQREDRDTLRVQSISGRLQAYTPFPVLSIDRPVDTDIAKLHSTQQQMAGNRQQQVAILLYRERPNTLFWIRMAEMRLCNHFFLIPIPFAAVEQALTDRATSIGLLARYAENYLPGSDLFDDRNAIGDTLCFFGRGKLLHSLEEDLRRIQGIGLFGLRKSGKTSVLLQLGFTLREYPVVHIDLQCYGGKLYYGAELCNQILQELAKLIQDRHSNSAISLVPFPRDSPVVNVITDFSRKIRDFDRLLKEAGYQQPILLFLDEIERILPTKLDPPERVEEFNALLGALRELSQIQRCLSLLIADLHPDVNRINYWSQEGVPTNPVFSFFKEFFVTPFDREETIEMLTKIGQLMGVDFDEDLLTAIHEESGGHPFMARQLGSLLCKTVNSEKSEGSQSIKMSEAQRYLNRVFKHSGILKDYLEQNIWTDLQKRDFGSAMAVLKLLACNETLAEGVSETALLNRLSSDFSENECTNAIIWLEAMGLIARQELEEEDSYRLQVRLMVRWLRMQMKAEEICQWQLP